MCGIGSAMLSFVSPFLVRTWLGRFPGVYFRLGGPAWSPYGWADFE